MDAINVPVAIIMLVDAAKIGREEVMNEFNKLALIWEVTLIIITLVTLGFGTFLFSIGMVWQPLVIIGVGSAMFAKVGHHYPKN